MTRVTTDTCILCPNGCELEIRWVMEEAGARVLEITGHRCKRGVEYGTEEIVAPRRTVTTTVRVLGGLRPLVSVRTESPIPKDAIGICLMELRRATVEAPVGIGDVVIKDAAGTGIPVIATRSVRSAGDEEEG